MHTEVNNKEKGVHVYVQLVLSVWKKDNESTRGVTGDWMSIDLLERQMCHALSYRAKEIRPCMYVSLKFSLFIFLSLFLSFCQTHT